MTKNVTKTERKFKSEQHALMTAAIALLKYTQDGYLSTSYYMPSEQYSNGKHAIYEVTIHHQYEADIEICEYLEPSQYEKSYHEANGETEAFACTTLRYEYDY